MYKGEDFTHKKIFTTKQANTLPKGSVQSIFPDKGKMATGPVLWPHGIQEN